MRQAFSATVCQVDCLSAKELDADFWDKFNCPGKRNGGLVVCDGTYRYRVFSFEAALMDPSGGWRYGKRFKCNLQLCFEIVQWCKLL